LKLFENETGVRFFNHRVVEQGLVWLSNGLKIEP